MGIFRRGEGTNWREWGATLIDLQNRESEADSLPSIQQVQNHVEVSSPEMAAHGHERPAGSEGLGGPETTDSARMTASELAAKKMLLPYIDKLSFIEIALAQVNVTSF